MHPKVHIRTDRHNQCNRPPPKMTQEAESKATSGCEKRPVPHPSVTSVFLNASEAVGVNRLRPIRASHGF